MSKSLLAIYPHHTTHLETVTPRNSTTFTSGCASESGLSTGHCASFDWPSSISPAFTQQKPKSSLGPPPSSSPYTPQSKTSASFPARTTTSTSPDAGGVSGSHTPSPLSVGVRHVKALPKPPRKSSLPSKRSARAAALTPKKPQIRFPAATTAAAATGSPP